MRAPCVSTEELSAGERKYAPVLRTRAEAVAGLGLIPCFALGCLEYVTVTHLTVCRSAVIAPTHLPGLSGGSMHIPVVGT